MATPPDSSPVLEELRAALLAPSPPVRPIPDSVAMATLDLLSVVPALPEEIVAFTIREVSKFYDPKVLDRLVADGWAEAATASLPWTGKLYRMSRAQRRAVLRLDRTDPMLSVRMARRTLAETRSGFEQYPPALDRWCALVLHGEAFPYQIAQRFDAEFEHALGEARQLGLDTSSEATVLLDAAEPLAIALDGPMRVAYARAQRALELYHRRSADLRFLDNYLERPELDAALRHLVSQDDSWALHYLGAGGAGKTMFLRHLEAHLAPQMKLATARVDFDHLNPNYPLRSPGLLLLGFAEELRLAAPEAAVDAFRKLQSVLTEVHHTLDEAQRSGREMLAGFDAPGFNLALDCFVLALGHIFQSGRRPVLILDTCEELARITPDRQQPRTVGETFRILESIHESLPAVRVVFSGRRALALQGAGWRCDRDELAVREYLMLCPIAGFLEGEARQYLRHYGLRSMPPDPIPERYHEAILRLSVDANAGELTKIEAVSPYAMNQVGVDERTRYNPYDIALFAKWAASGDDFDAEIGSAGRQNYYVRERIVGHLRRDLARWLPTLTVLGRFDEELAADLTSPADDFGVLWAEIRRQEWVDMDRGTATVQEKAPLPFWTINRRMRARLEAYYAEEVPGEWRAARQRVADRLAKWTLERDWELLTPSYFAVCVHLLRDEPRHAAEWWSRVEARILSSDAWDWADKITTVLLSAEADALHGPDGAHALEAPIYALRANVLMRQFADPELLGDAWKRVEFAAESYPDEAGRKLLRFRALVGHISRFRYVDRILNEAAGSELADLLAAFSLRRWNWIPDEQNGVQLRYTLRAFWESVGEISDRMQERQWDQFVHAAMADQWLMREVSTDMDPYDRMCVARFQAPFYPGLPILGERWDEPPGSLGTHGFDWIPPADLYARQLLEWGRIFEKKGLDASRAIRFLALASQQAGTSPRYLDQDRLLSQAIRLFRLERSDLGAWWRVVPSSIAIGNEREECQAHRLVPPLYATVIQVSAGQGDVDMAISLLSQARSGQPSRPVLRWLNGVSTYINRRFRLAEPESDVFEIPEAPVNQDNDVARFLDAAAWALRKLADQKLDEPGFQSVQRTGEPLFARLGLNVPQEASDLKEVARGWQPWMARYLLIVESSRPEPDKARLAAVREALAALYPSGKAPQDIAFALRERRSWDWAWALLGFSMFGAVMYGLARLVGKGSQAIFGIYLSLWQNLLIVAGLVSLGLAIPSLFRRYMRAVSRLLQARLTVRRKQDSNDIEIEAAGRIYFVWALKSVIKVIPPVEERDSYAKIAEALAPARLYTGFPRLLQSISSGYLRIRADVTIAGDLSLAAPCWEALTSMSKQRSATQFAFRRMAAWSQRSVGPFSGTMSSYTVSPGGSLRFRCAAVRGEPRGQAAFPAYPMEDVGIAVLQTEVGLVEGTTRFVTPKGYCTPNEVVRLFPKLRLCILVDLERGEASARTAVDRASAARVRVAAHELSLNGVAAVITIPPLVVEDDLLNRVLGRLAKAATAVTNAREPLRSAVRDVQELISKQPDMTTEDAAELAYDVCYYAADVVNLKSRRAEKNILMEAVRS